jgi:hypothetical protein
MARAHSPRLVSAAGYDVLVRPGGASFGPTNLSAPLVVFTPGGEAAQAFEITTLEFVPSLHKLFTGVWKGLSFGVRNHVTCCTASWP